MLRALTSYFFGGIEDQTPEAPIECETREVNDWLVVNLPDQNKENISLNDEDEMYEIDDDDIRNEMDDDDAIEVDASDTIEMDSDEDDILLSLSFLMMPMDAEKFSSELSTIQYSFESSVLEDPFGFSLLTPSFLKFDCGDIDSRQPINVGRTPKQIGELIIPFETAIQQDILNEDHKEVLLNMMVGSRIQQRAQRNEIVNEFERMDKVHIHVLDLTPPPMYSKNYVNHRHPEKLLNQDLLQRIKELEPEQQALQRSTKKTLTRGQLNRQNKNYMYEASSKKNRRSKMQRNRSGANNNRKC